MGTFAIRAHHLGLAAGCVLALAACTGEPAVTGAAPDEAVVTASPSTPSPSPTPTSSPTPTPTPSPIAFHDFTAIEGDWEGVVKEGATGAVERWLVTSIRAGGSKNEILGETSWLRSASATEPVCRVAWLIESADPPTYEARQMGAPGCVSADVELVHDPDTETLKFRATVPGRGPDFSAFGTLERSEQ